MESQLAAEYLELWEKLLVSLDDYFPEVVAAGLATTHTKVSVDALDAICEKHEEIARLKQELKGLDQRHTDLLASLKEKGLQSQSQETNRTIKYSAAPTRSDTAVRSADFIMGLIVSLQRDFSQNPELTHILQSLYLFVQANQREP